MILSKKFWQEKTTFFIVVLLLSSTFIMLIQPVTANTFAFDEGMNDEDGVYYTSTFGDVERYFGGCKLSDSGNKLTLDPSGSQYGNYNFIDWDETSLDEASWGEIFWFSPLLPKVLLSAFENTIVTGTNYWAMSEDDIYEYPRDGREDPTLKQQFHHFRFKITQDIDTISSFEILWKGSAHNHKLVKLFVWKPVYGAFGIWQEIDNRITNDTDIQLFYENESLPLDDDGFIDLCVVVVPEIGLECYIQTNFINIKVKGSGYATEGGARFSPIIPEDITRWERFQWSGYEKTGTSISFQFFDYDDGTYDLISNNNISGNSNGLSNKLIDLSDVPISTNLTVNVTLETTDLSFSPELYEWGLSWQRTDEHWQDLFSSDLRVEESKLQNIRISDGKAHLVTTVYDWPMFGHNAQNTRSSPGLGPGTHYSLCWESDEQVGGNNKNPIVNDGNIYIADYESAQIYEYDAQYEDGSPYNAKRDTSGVLGFDIKNSPLATTKNTIVVATGSSTDGGEIINQVFGLNANDLQTQEWTFSYDSVDPDDLGICFDSSPVLKDNMIYLTSWNGDSSLLTDVFDFLNLSTGNNKLICLTDGGSYEWSVDLPAGSFSSPAVVDDTIVVGCEKFNGDSLLAYTLDGTKIWAENVGPIGYASPVIVDDTVYVVSKKLSQSLVTAYSQVMAVDLDDGSIKWNTTIGDLIPEIYENAAVSNPILVGGYVYVASPDGILYKIDADDGSIVKSVKIYNKGVSSMVVKSSPAYADGLLYIGTPDGYFRVINIVTLEEAWKKRTDSINPIYSSPIIVDGFVYYCDEDGYLYCRGEQQISDDQQITGELISTPIILPNDDLYWNRFEVDDDTNSGDITYSILDNNYKVLVDDIEDYELLNDDSLEDISTIRLKAEFHANAKEIVTLDFWKVSFKDAPPTPPGETVFSNFNKDMSDPPIFTVKVRNDDIGLINTSAKFKLEYSNETEGTFETDWLPANMTGENKTKNKETITANMSYIDFIEEIDLFHKIKFSVNNTQNETIHSDWYTIQGVPDNEPPLFYLDSFTPDPAYISTMTPTCTIQAKDGGSNGNVTGINVSSAQYTIKYNDGDTFTSDADCSGSQGTTSKVTITADISESTIADDITSLESIWFYIEDVYANDNRTDWIDLYYDHTPPESSISNSIDIPQFSNASFILINATAEDPDEDDEYTSGIKTISLYYRKKGTTQWTEFDSACSSSTCSWEFTINSNAGGEYEICSIATDNATNKESFPDDGDVFFTYDPNPPTVSFTNSILEITNDSSPPTFNQITFEDDYKLDRIYYRLNSEGINNWTLIMTTDDDKEIPEWTITESQFNDMVEDEIAYIYFRVIDALGNTFVTSSTSSAFRVRKNIEDVTEFTLDTKDFKTWQWDNSFLIRVNTQNASVTSMILWYRFAGDDDNTTANWTRYSKSLNSTPYEWDFSPDDGEGYYQFYVEIVTAQGMSTTTSIESVYVTLFPIMELVTVLIVTVILFAISGLVIKKYRGNKKNRSL